MIRNMISLSEVGLCRSNNQDAVLAVHTDETGLFVVADGMGGHDRGELASQSVVQMLHTWWRETAESRLSAVFSEIVRELETKIKEMNRCIFRMYQEGGQRGGTTLCLLFIYRDAYAVMNIGDSRLYKSQGRRWQQITTDDVWENQPSVRQSMCEAEIRRHPSYGKLLQALGANDNIRLSVRTGTVEKGTCFLLCSDGIYKYCREWRLEVRLKRIRNQSDMDTFSEKIKKEVYKSGAKDNLSMIMVLAE